MMKPTILARRRTRDGGPEGALPFCAAALPAAAAAALPGAAIVGALPGAAAGAAGAANCARCAAASPTRGGLTGAPELALRCAGAATGGARAALATLAAKSSASDLLRGRTVRGLFPICTCIAHQLMCYTKCNSACRNSFASKQFNESANDILSTCIAGLSLQRYGTHAGRMRDIVMHRCPGLRGSS